MKKTVAFLSSVLLFLPVIKTSSAVCSGYACVREAFHCHITIDAIFTNCGNNLSNTGHSLCGPATEADLVVEYYWNADNDISDCYGVTLHSSDIPLPPENSLNNQNGAVYIHHGFSYTLHYFLYSTQINGHFSGYITCFEWNMSLCNPFGY